jgi:hypothetical protein
MRAGTGQARIGRVNLAHVFNALRRRTARVVKLADTAATAVLCATKPAKMFE